MKPTQINTDPDTAVLVGVNCEPDALYELSGLCDACGILTAGCITQNIKEIDGAFYIGRGKVGEVKDLVNETGATCVVFDVELSGSKVRNLEDEIGVPVLDRSKIILDIFASRATSAEGKLQVDLAQLKYNLPRLAGIGANLAKMKNGVGMRGPGEKKLELDRRKIRGEISALEKHIEKLKLTRQQARKSAIKNQIPRVTLVGYTNSGKSTLLNTMAKTREFAHDMLFATLDAKTARVHLDGGTNILLTDTVGFIDKLPHEFIAAFESTLDEVRFADILIHVIDASNPDRDRQINVVNETIQKIGADHIPVILAYNKIDRPHAPIPSCAIEISAQNNTNIDLLKERIAHIIIK